MPVLRAIDRPVTLAILPHLPYSKPMAEFGRAQRFEVMLHLPLEPQAGQVPSQGLERRTVTTRMSRDEVGERLAAALESVPHARGVNNHMGSQATQDARLMRIVLEELAARRLYFVDSLVTSSSVCRRVASEVGIAFGERAIFLDNEPQPAYIEKQLMRLVAVAQRDGRAIGIGHDRRLTLSVIRRTIPAMEAQGVRLVRVSDVVEKP